MSEPRTVVYVTDNGLVKVRDGINYRKERVALASDPAVAKYPLDFREVGTVGADGLARIIMLGDAATHRLVVDFITPIGVEPSEPVPSAWSPPGIPDLAGAYRECIAALTVSHTPLTWESVAAWLQETYDLPRRLRRGSDDFADLHWKTVAGWAGRAGLPHPREFRVK